jgi:hypothetical protein
MCSQNKCIDLVGTGHFILLLPPPMMGARGDEWLEKIV